MGARIRPLRVTAAAGRDTLVGQLDGRRAWRTIPDTRSPTRLARHMASATPGRPGLRRAIRSSSGPAGQTICRARVRQGVTPPHRCYSAYSPCRRRSHRFTISPKSPWQPFWRPRSGAAPPPRCSESCFRPAMSTLRLIAKDRSIYARRAAHHPTVGPPMACHWRRQAQHAGGRPHWAMST